MDERIFRVKTGQPIPEWDAAHRLPIVGGVGPEVRDSATIFRVNSKYMDVSDQPHMMRQWLAGGTLLVMFFSIVFILFTSFIVLRRLPEYLDISYFFLVLIFGGGAIGFMYVGIKFGSDEIFALTRRPIRFNRKERKVYAMRHRRFFTAKRDGDIIFEIPWSDESFFCVHRGPVNTQHSDSYHIRCYQLDDKGMVSYGFAIGREWDEIDGLNDLLCQWNYWCWYMSHGPAELPEPLLFLSEREGLIESFLYCMYEFGFGASGTFRIMAMPAFFWLTIQRVVSLWTCRAPIWPKEVENASGIDKDDPYDQPSSDTPVGWAATTHAHQAGIYPADPKRKTPNWCGETDGLKNARRWAAETAPNPACT